MTKSILIVEFNQVVRKATREFLEANTMFKVCGEGADGLHAITKARQLKPDLVILDVKLPGLDGLQTAQAIKRIRPVPIILFTFYAGAIRSQDVLSAGINVVVSKVSDFSILTEQVNPLLNATRRVGRATA